MNFGYPHLRMTLNGNACAYFETNFNETAIRFFQLEKRGAFIAHQAHDEPIVTAKLHSNNQLLTTVDKTGLVRNWFDRMPHSEWRIPSFRQPSSVAISDNSIMVLKWRSENESQSSSEVPWIDVWDYARASFKTDVFNRESGRLLLNLPERSFSGEEESPSPSKEYAKQLSSHEREFLPRLSPTGKYLINVSNRQESLVNCMNLVSGERVFSKRFEKLRRIGFCRDEDRALVLTREPSSDPIAYRLHCHVLGQNTWTKEVRLIVPDKTAQELKELDSLHVSQREIRRKFARLGGKINAGRLEVLKPSELLGVFPAWRAQSSSEESMSWEPVFNRHDYELQSLMPLPFTLSLPDAMYIDFKQKTNTLRIRNAQSKIIRELPFSTPLSYSAPSLSVDSTHLLSFGPDHLLRTVSLENGEECVFELPMNRVTGVDLSSDQRLFWDDTGRITIVAEGHQ